MKRVTFIYAVSLLLMSSLGWALEASFKALPPYWASVKLVEAILEDETLRTCMTYEGVATGIANVTFEPDENTYSVSADRGIRLRGSYNYTSPSRRVGPAKPELGDRTCSQPSRVGKSFWGFDSSREAILFLIQDGIVPDVTGNYAAISFIQILRRRAGGAYEILVGVRPGRVRFYVDLEKEELIMLPPDEDE